MTDHDEVDTVTDFCTEISRILTVRTVHTGQTIKNDEWIHCKKGNAFVDSVDPDKRYLSKRRYITKAKFDVYFSVRTAAEQFVERQNLLKNIPWEILPADHACVNVLEIMPFGGLYELGLKNKL